MTTTPRFCTQCGAPISEKARFCSQCGKPVQQSTAPTLPPIPVPPPPEPALPRQPEFQPPAGHQSVISSSAEPILSITPGLQRKKGALGLAVETFSLIITPSRLIFAYLDKQRMSQLVAQARDQARAQGKGFLGQLGAQLGWISLLERELANTPPQQVLAQDPRSFYIPNHAITKVRLRQTTNSEGQTSSYVQVVITTSSGKQRFQLPSAVNVSRRELRRRLQQTLGNITR